MATYFGIDFGTTQTTIIEYGRPGNERRIAPVPIYYEKYQYDPVNCRYLPGMSKDYVMPSVMYLDDRLDTQGKVNTFRLVGTPAQERVEYLNDYGDRYYTNPKAELEGDDTPDDANQIPPSEICYEILRTCFLSIREYVRRKMSLGESYMEERALIAQLNRAKYGISSPLATSSIFSRAISAVARKVAADIGITTNNNIFTVEEPTAALTNYLDRELYCIGKAEEEQRLHPGQELSYDGPVDVSGKVQVALTIDLGGGTSDVAVRPYYIQTSEEVTRTGRKKLIRRICFLNSYLREGKKIYSANNPHSNLGGIDFDARLAGFLMRRYNECYLENGRRPFLLYRLDPDITQYNFSCLFSDWVTDSMKKRITGIANLNARKLKESVWLNPEVQKMPEVYGLTQEKERFRFSCSITREEYRFLLNTRIRENATRGYLTWSGEREKETIETLVKSTVRKAGLDSFSGIDFVYLTGGTSRMPMIREWLKESVGGNCPIIWAEDESTSVEGSPFMNMNCLTDIASGIAISLDKDKVNDRISHSLSKAILVDVGTGLPRVLVPAGTACPSGDELREPVPVNQLVGIHIMLYSALDEHSPSMRLIGGYELAKNQIFPEGAQVRFRYAIDGDKQVTLFVTYRSDEGEEIIHRLNNLEYTEE